jgi:hypothetical protein
MPIDKNLFTYLTRRAGYDMDDVAKLWGCDRSGVSRRLSGAVKLTRDDMEAWMRLVGVADAGPVFFPAIVTETGQASAVVPGGVNG